jgi:hypothetical protein
MNKKEIEDIHKTINDNNFKIEVGESIYLISKNWVDDFFIT